MVEAIDNEASVSAVLPVDPLLGFAGSVQELEAAPVPAAVLEVPTERVVAVSASGALLLDPEGGPVVGRNFEDFTTDGPSGALDLFASGQVNGYETTRMLRRTGREPLPVSVWLHEFDHEAPSRFAVTVFSVPEVIGPVSPRSEDAGEPSAVGTTDRQLVIERISNDATALFGVPSATLPGQPLTEVVTEDDRPALLAAITGAAARNRAVTLNVRMAPRDAAADATGVAVCQAVILPMEPPPSCAFVFLRVPDASSVVPSYPPDLSGLLLRLRRGAEVAVLAQRLNELSDRDLPGLRELSTREWEIVARLFDGDRVPAIAATLYLSPSTVRSHLALVFAKLHVSSQQELLDLLRQKGAAAS